MEEPQDNAATENTQPAPVVNTEAVPKKPRSKFLAPLVVAGAIVLAGGAAAYQAAFSKTPEQLFESALTNTGSAFEKFLNIEDTRKGLKVDGTFDVSTPLSIDGTVSGQWYESNGSLKADIGAAGLRVQSEVRTIKPDNSDVPDIYAKLSGLEGVSGLLSAVGGFDSDATAILSELNEQWYVIDHTLIEQSLLGASQSGSAELSREDMKQITDAVAASVNERLFGSDDDKAVFKINEKIGKEDFEGTDTYKLQVGVDKSNFAAFIKSFESVVKDTKLKDIISMSAPGQNIDELLDFSSVSDDLNEVDFSKATADVWVEGGGRFIRNVRIYPNESEEDKNYIDFMVPYEGGDVIPVVMRVTLEDSQGKGVLSFGVDINQESGDSRMWFDIDVDAVGQQVAAKAELSFVGTDEQITIDKPADAKSAVSLINQLTEGVQSLFPSLPSPGIEDFDSFGDFDATQFDDVEIPTQNFQL